MRQEMRAVIFDMGGVLISFSQRQVLAPWFEDETELELVRRVVFDSGDWWSLDHGSLSEKQALARWVAAVPETLRQRVEEMFAHWHETCLPIAGMAELIRDLKAGGYGCYLLSNTSPRFHVYRDSVESLRLLDGYFLSCEHRLSKPDPAIYRAMTAQFGLDPAACFFVDDTPPNVEGACSVGMQGAVFSGDVAALRAVLRRAGFHF